MSTVKADYLVNAAGTGAPTFTNGIKTPSILDASGGNTVTVNGSIPASVASPALTGTPTAPTAAVGTNTTQIATTAFVLANVLNKQTFTSSGTWTKPSGASLVLVRVWGAGGGGAGGDVAGAGLTKADVGGGGGAYFEKYFYPSVLSATVTVTVGAAGTGGASDTSGGDGGTSSFGAYIESGGGFRGISGSNILGMGGNAQGATSGTSSINAPSLVGGSQTAGYYGGGAGGHSGVAGFSSQFGGGGGGSGGWENSSSVLQSPGAGGQSNYNTGFGAAGTSSAGAPTAGGAATGAGCGGGGGGSAQTANGAAGGAGGFPGGGGGGGGSTRTGFSGGTGGTGGAGYVEVYTW